VAEIWKFVVPGQPEQNKFADTISTEKKWEVVICSYHPSYRRKHKIGESQSSLTWAKSKNLS
jgi:hypothetical protein